MPNLLAMSFEGDLAPSFDLLCLREGRHAPDGWGIGFYPGGEPSASVLKEPAPQRGSIRSDLVRAWEHLASSLFVLHMRSATWGRVSDANTQPFSRSHGGRDWLFAHAGSLHQRLVPPEGARFEPVGSTDTEAIFCDLLGRFAENGARTLADVAPTDLREWLASLNRHGGLSCVLSDGLDLVVYADARGEGALYASHIRPPYESLRFGNADLEVDLSRRGVIARKGVVVSSEPLEGDATPLASFTRVEPGSLLVLRQGAIRAEVRDDAGAAASAVVPWRIARPARAEPQRLRIVHRTSYRYARPVERSSHVLRLTPVHDHRQELLSHEILVSVAGRERSFEDVFGNRTRGILIEHPYDELVVDARSVVEVRDADPLGFRPLRARTSIPLVWMPWQGAMLQPYLLPPELPETELDELASYAMSFVERNGYDLLDTLLDVNRSIFEEYAYVQGTTTLATTAFDVYVSRRGVCQDFTNLFICLARLLGVPARYVCGYLHTGREHENQRQSEASHAWVEVYLPELGWRGFDPTNGVLAQTSHVRVAVGRHYRDATPTSGTIYLGGGAETLEVDVRVEREG